MPHVAASVGPQSFMEELEAFASAIRWNEPLVYSVAAFHVVIVMLIFRFRRSSTALFTLFGCLCLVTANLRTLNSLLMMYPLPEYITTQTYFDDSAHFIMTMVGLPVVIEAVLLLGVLLHYAASLLISVKRKELAGKPKKE